MTTKTTTHTAEAPYTVTPRNFWGPCRDGALAYAATLPGVTDVRADNNRRVILLDGRTKASVSKAAAKVEELFPAAVAALRQRDAQDRSSITEARRTAKGRAARWQAEVAFLTAYVTKGGAAK